MVVLYVGELVLCAGLSLALLLLHYYTHMTTTALQHCQALASPSLYINAHMRRMSRRHSQDRTAVGSLVHFSDTSSRYRQPLWREAVASPESPLYSPSLDTIYEARFFAIPLHL